MVPQDRAVRQDTKVHKEQMGLLDAVVHQGIVAWMVHQAHAVHQVCLVSLDRLVLTAHRAHAVHQAHADRLALMVLMARAEHLEVLVPEAQMDQMDWQDRVELWALVGRLAPAAHLDLLEHKGHAE